MSSKWARWKGTKITQQALQHWLCRYSRCPEVAGSHLCVPRASREELSNAIRGAWCGWVCNFMPRRHMFDLSDGFCFWSCLTYLFVAQPVPVGTYTNTTSISVSAKTNWTKIRDDMNVPTSTVILDIHYIVSCTVKHDCWAIFRLLLDLCFKAAPRSRSQISGFPRTCFSAFLIIVIKTMIFEATQKSSQFISSYTIVVLFGLDMLVFFWNGFDWLFLCWGTALRCCVVLLQWDRPTSWRQRRVGCVQWIVLIFHLQWFFCIPVKLKSHVFCIRRPLYMYMYMYEHKKTYHSSDTSFHCFFRCFKEFVIRPGKCLSIGRLRFWMPSFRHLSSPPDWWLLELWCDDLCDDLRGVAIYHQETLDLHVLYDRNDVDHKRSCIPALNYQKKRYNMGILAHLLKWNDKQKERPTVSHGCQSGFHQFTFRIQHHKA